MAKALELTADTLTVVPSMPRAAQVAAAKIGRTALVLVGGALAARDFRDSALYDAEYRRRFRGGAA